MSTVSQGHPTTARARLFVETFEQRLPLSSGYRRQIHARHIRICDVMPS